MQTPHYLQIPPAAMLKSAVSHDIKTLVQYTLGLGAYIWLGCWAILTNLYPNQTWLTKSLSFASLFLLSFYALGIIAAAKYTPNWFIYQLSWLAWDIFLCLLGLGILFSKADQIGPLIPLIIIALCCEAIWNRTLERIYTWRLHHAKNQ